MKEILSGNEVDVHLECELRSLLGQSGNIECKNLVINTR